MKDNQKEAGGAILVSSDVSFKAKRTDRGK